MIHRSGPLRDPERTDAALAEEAELEAEAEWWDGLSGLFEWVVLGLTVLLVGIAVWGSYVG